MKIVKADEMLLSTAGRIHSESWRQSHRAFCTDSFLALHTPEHQTAYLRETVEKGADLFVLLENGDAVGIVTVQGDLIENLYILPAEQNKGYGTALLHYAEKQCKGVPKLWILDNNTRAKRLYEREGYSLTGKKNAITDTLSELEMSK